MKGNNFVLICSLHDSSIPLILVESPLPPPTPRVVYFFPDGVPFPIENVKFWPIFSLFYRDPRILFSSDPGIFKNQIPGFFWIFESQ